MKRIGYVLLMIMVLSFNEIKAQTLPAVQKILFCTENSEQKDLILPYGTKIQNCYSIHQTFFVINNGPTFDQRLMKTSLDKIIPNVNETGFAVLDWEGPAYWEVLHPGKFTSDTIINNFLFALRYAKKLRPNIKWGYFGFPPRKYVVRGEDWVDYSIPVLKEVDIITPSSYLWYQGVEGFGDKWTTQLLMSYNIQYAIKMGILLNKPVYPFIWKRYGDNAKLIDVSSFTQYVKAILSTEYLGHRVDGIWWYSTLNFYYDNRSQFPLLVDEFKNVTDIKVYEAKLIKTYLDSIMPYVKQ